jgi:hypothetical protein
MSIRIELRYAVLTSLLVLLWLIMEFEIGLQDKYVAFHPYISLLAFLIPVVTYRLAIREKIEEKYGKLSFKQAFVSGLLMTFFCSILAVPIQIGFQKLVNPDFFETMITYTAQKSHSTMEQAAQYFNPRNYIAEQVLYTFIIGTIISLILAFRMRTVK